MRPFNSTGVSFARAIRTMPAIGSHLSLRSFSSTKIVGRFFTPGFRPPLRSPGADPRDILALYYFCN